MRLNPQGCFIAYDRGTRLGLTTTTIYGRKLAWIGNVIVDKNNRGKHVGQGLVEHAVSSLQKSRAKHIALYCFKEHEKFYENLGFVRDRPFLRLRLNAPKAEYHKNPIQLRRAPSFSGIMAADKEAFGADRSELIRAVLAEKAGWYLGSSRGISSPSYLLVKEYSEDCEFGPWICIDPLRDHPSEMIVRALSMTRSVPIEISCLRENGMALKTLKANGFRTIREGFRMFFGEKGRIGNDRLQYALGFLDKG
jgi:hypothetical protein